MKKLKILALTLLACLIISAIVATFSIALGCDYSFSANIQPNSTNAGASATYSMTVANEHGSGAVIGSIKVNIPSGYTGVTVSSVDPSNWIVSSQSSSQISLKPDHSSHAIDRGDSLTVTFTATAPRSSGEYVWTTTCNTNTGDGGHQFSIIGDQPTVTVTPNLTLNPISGFVGTMVTVSGSGFYPSSTITIKYSGSTEATVKSTSSGSLPSRVTFTVPASATGDHSVSATDSKGNTIAAIFTVIPAIQLNPTYGPVTTSVAVTGTGFASSSTITATFGGASVTLSGTKKSDSSGSFSDTTFTVPTPSTLGTKAVVIKDSKTNSASATFTVTHSEVVDHITISPNTASISAGTPQTYAATAYDSQGNSWDVTATYGIDTSAGGLWSSNVYTSQKAGHWTVTGNYASKQATASLTVNALTKNSFVISTISTPQTAGSLFSITITAVDQYGNTVTSYNGINTLTDLSGTINPSTTVTFSNGVWSGQVSITKAITNDIISTANGEITGTSNTFDVISAGMSQLVFTNGVGQSLPAGTLSSLITVQRQDQYGNPVTSGSTTINLASTSTGATFYSDAGITTLTTLTISESSSTTDFYYKDTTAGTPTLTATSSEFIPATPIFTGFTPASTILTIDGYPVIFTETGLPDATQWSVTFGGSLYTSTTSTITINDASAITYQWSTQSIISGATGVQYITTSTSGLMAVPESTTQIIPFTTQYQVTYATTGNSLPVTTPNSEWINANGIATGAFPTQVTNEAGSVKCTFVSDNRPSTITAPSLITGTYQTQYYIIVTSAHGSPNKQSQWVNAGSYFAVSVTSPDGDATHQFVVNGAATQTITNVQAAQTLVFTWTEQFYLTVISTQGTTRGSGWYNTGSTANFEVTNTASSSGNTQQSFSQWTGIGDGSYTGTNLAHTIKMTDAVTETASWNTQYKVTYFATGSDIAINLPATEWVTAGTAVTGIFPSEVTSSSADTRSSLVSDNRPTKITMPTTITANYQTQYKVTFSQTGIGPDSTGTIATISGDEKDFSQIANTTWINSGAQITFKFEANVASTTTGQQYTLSSVSAPSPQTINMPITIQATYQPILSTSLYTVAEAGLVNYSP